MNSCGLKRLLYRRGRMEGVFFNTDFENAYRLLLEWHLYFRTGRRKGRLLRGINMQRSNCLKMSGGHFSVTWNTYIRNMRCMTGIASYSFLMDIFPAFGRGGLIK